MTDATIWHNPRCSKSRAALALLRSLDGVDVSVVEYLRDPPTRDQLVAAFAAAGIGAADALRLGEPVARELKLGSADEDRILDAMVANPILIERPIVMTDRGTVIARPADRVHAIV